MAGLIRSCGQLWDRAALQLRHEVCSQHRCVESVVCGRGSVEGDVTALRVLQQVQLTENRRTRGVKAAGCESADG